MSRKIPASWVLVGALGAAFSAYNLTRSQHEKNHQILSLQRSSRIIQTNRGPIETLIEGSGPPVLLVHGALGGYDRARLYSFPEAGFRFICPSRPGYLRTPLHVGSSFSEQADACAALLDALEIEKAAVIGCSAGGPVAIDLVLRHPDRCWALVLENAITGPLSRTHGLMQPISEMFFGLDWLTWYGVNRIVLYALRPELFKHVRGDSTKQRRILAMLRTMYPTSVRKAGFGNDMYQIQNTAGYLLDDICVPTLVVHGTADAVVPYYHGQRAATTIPGAQFLSIESGTHLDFISHIELIHPHLTAFLRSHCPKEAYG